MNQENVQNHQEKTLHSKKLSNQMTPKCEEKLNIPAEYILWMIKYIINNAECVKMIFAQSFEQKLNTNQKLKDSFNEESTNYSLNASLDTTINLNNFNAQIPVQKKYNFCFNKEKPEALVMLSPIQDIPKYFVSDEMITKYACIDNSEDLIWEKTIEKLQKKLNIQILVFRSFEEYEEQAWKNLNICFFIVICSPSIRPKGLVDFNIELLKTGQTYLSLYYDPQENIKRQTNEELKCVNFRQNYEQLQKLIKTHKKDKRCKQRVLPNFVFIDEKEVGISHQLINIMHSMLMLNQKEDKILHQILVDNLQSVYNKLNHLPEVVSKSNKDFSSDTTMMDTFFKLLKKGGTLEQYCKWYSKQNIYNYKIINSFLRSCKFSTELYYIQPYFKPLFESIQTQYRQNRDPKKSEMTFYRGAFMQKSQYLKFKNNIGKIILGLGFISTSLSEQTALRFNQTMIKIKVNQKEINGQSIYDYGYANISRYSEFFGEQEVLFNPLSSFLILNAYESQKTGRNTIQLQYGAFSKCCSQEDALLIQNEDMIRRVGLLLRENALSIKGQGDTKFQTSLAEQIYWRKFQSLYSELKYEGEDYIRIIENLGIVLYKRGKFDQANHYLQISKMKKESTNTQSIHQASIWNNLAIVKEEKGDLSRAIQLYKKALQLLISQFTQQDKYYALALSKILNPQITMNLQGAEKYQKQDIFFSHIKYILKNKPFSAQNYLKPQNIPRKNMDGSSNQMEGIFSGRRLGDAKVLRTIALKHQSYSNKFKKQGDCLTQFNKNLEGAEQYWKMYLQIIYSSIKTCDDKKCFQIIEGTIKLIIIENNKMQAKNEKINYFFQLNEAFISILENFAALLDDVGYSLQALQLCKISEFIKYHLLGEEHPSFAKCLNNMAVIYTRNNIDVNKGYELYERIENILLKVQGVNEHYGCVVNNIANSQLLKKGLESQALDLYKKSAQIRLYYLDKRHPDYIKSLNNLALTHFKIGNNDEAKKTLNQCVEVLKMTLGQSSQTYKICKKNLEKCSSLIMKKE